jgi:peptidoglycan/LPS O-acetylase OafA/YrhL
MNTYRADINGLRGIAILVVIFFHFQIPFFSKGFLGVDVFFVISGYFITSVILKDLNNNNFQFISFYKRRIRRLLPALFFMLLITTIFSILIFDFKTLLFYGKSLICTLLMSSNFYFSRNVGYFAINAHQIPLLHTWSLAVEEQFYLIFPFLLFYIQKLKKIQIQILTVTIVLISIFISMVYYEKNVQFRFYMLNFRVWEFLVGSFLVLPINFPSSNKKLYALFSLIGFILIILPIIQPFGLIFSEKFLVFYPVIGSALIIHFGQTNSLITKFLSLPILVFLGKISYSIYLWHWVLFVFYRYLTLDEFVPIETCGLLLFLFLISYLSWRYIEYPFYFAKNKITDKKVFLIILSGGLILILLGSIIIFTDGLPARFPESKLLAELKKDSTQILLIKSEEKLKTLRHYTSLPIIGNKNKNPEMILWGDSHARCLASGLNVLCKDTSLYIASQSSCIPLQGIDINGTDNSLNSMSSNSEKVLAFIKHNPKIKTVFLGGFWSTYVKNAQNKRLVKLQNQNSNNENQNTNFSLFEHGLRSTLRTLHLNNIKIKILIITDVPNIIYSPENYIIKSKFTGQGLNKLTPERRYYEINNKEINNLFYNLKKEGLIYDVLPLHEEFFQFNKSIIQENNHLLYEDNNHLSHMGSLKASNIILKFIKKSNYSDKTN